MGYRWLHETGTCKCVGNLQAYLHRWGKSTTLEHRSVHRKPRHMGRKNSFLVFFFFLASLFWNPLTFAFFYSGTPVENSDLVRFVFYAIPVASILLAILIRRRGIGSRLFDSLVGFSFFLILTGSVILVNAILGRALPSLRKETSKKGLIFDANRTVVYKTTEFDFRAETNSLGLRDEEVAVERGGLYRILCFGDSWTFGWGVEVTDSWPKKLMRNLRSKGYEKVEVFNCGQPGIYTNGYLENMKAVLPQLKPDLVLVGVNQLDDLAQVYERKAGGGEVSQSLMKRLGVLSSSLLEASFGNYLIILGIVRDDKVTYIRDRWIRSMDDKMRTLDHSRRLRFERLDDTVRAMLLSGNLNPAAIRHYTEFPERSFIFNNPDLPVTRDAFKTMSGELRQIREVCERHSAKTVFVNMPNSEFTGHRVVRMPTDVLNVYLMENNRIDSMYRKLAADNGMDYIELTGHFLRLTPKDSFFFKYDGHPNLRGYEEIAGYVSEELIRKGYLK